MGEQQESIRVSLLRPHSSSLLPTAQSPASPPCGMWGGWCSKGVALLLFATGVLFLWRELGGSRFVLAGRAKRHSGASREMEGGPVSASEEARLVASAAKAAQYLGRTPAKESLVSEAEAALLRNQDGRMEALRGFAVVYFEDRGFLLLRATPRKGRILQLPGGHGDWQDFRVAFQRRTHKQPEATLSSNSQGVLRLGRQSLEVPTLAETVRSALRERAREQCGPQCEDGELENNLDKQLTLLEWGRAAAARELWEEIGLDLESRLDRLVPLPPVYRKSCSTFNFLLVVPVEEQKQLFSIAEKQQQPSKEQALTSKFNFTAVKAEGGNADTTVLRMDLNEHSGFLFESSLSDAVHHVEGHAKGRASEALKKLQALLDGGS